MTGLLRRTAPHALAGALCAGLGAANAIRAPGLTVAVLAGALALLALVVPADRRILALAGSLLLGGLWWGSERLESLDRSVLRAQAGETAPTVVLVTGPARRGSFSLRLPARVRRFGRLLLDEPVLLQLPLGRAPPQGAILRTVGTVEPPRGPEDGFDERAWLRRQGAAVVVDGGHWRLIGRRGGLGGAADRLRTRLLRTIAPGLGGERRAVLAGIVLGEDEGLSEPLRERFRAAGLFHLLAVSGQNVAFLVGGVLLVAWLLGAPRWLGEATALLAIGAYVLAVGWQPSVVRAGVAGALASLAWLAARPRDRWYFLLLGALVLLAWNPYSLLEPGFQLSFAAVAAIFVGVPRATRLLEGYPVPRWLGTVVAVSAVCGLATAPIQWIHFGAIPIFSIVSNALAAPVVAPLLGLGLVTAALSTFAPSAAAALAWINGWLAAYLAACARLVGGLPHAQLTSPVALAALSAAAVAVVLATRFSRPSRRRLFAGLALAGLLVGGWRLAPQAPVPPPTGLRITFLDVGQGDATLIQVPEGAVLVDQGPPEAHVADRLADLGIDRLELLVLTHPSRDNIGGARAVLERLDVGLVLDPALPHANPFGRPALEVARRRGIRIGVARAGQAYRLGKLRLRLLWPDGSARPEHDPNDHATVMVASYGSVDALLPADAESNVLLGRRLQPLEILKVGHHGSADQGLPELLRLVRPRVAVISVGATNDYGHPAPSTLAALEGQAGVRVYRTDRDGPVTIDSDGTRIEVRGER